MSNLTEVSQWEAGIYQIETTDPVLGGPTGISNTQPKQLANRTLYLLDRLRDSGMNYAADTGATNAFVANVPAAPTAWVDGAEYRFKAASTNTGAATFTPNNDPTTGIAAKPIYAGDNTALVGGEIVSGGAVTVRYVASLNAGNGGLVLIRSTGGVDRAGTPAVGDVSNSVATMSAVNAATDGMATVNVGGGSDVTLTPAQYGNAQLKLTGTPSVGINLVFPSTPGQWTVKNNQGGSQNITAKTPASGGATVVVPQGVTVILSSDGTDVVLASASGQASFRQVSITGVTGSTLTVSGGYTVGAILVEKNGGLLEPADFTATNGSTIVLTTAAVSSDKFTVYAFSSFSIANALKKTGDTMVGTLTLAADGANPLEAATKQQVDAAAAAGVGFGQTPQVVTRVAGTTYVNTTSRPILVSFYWTAPANIQANLIVNGVVADASSNSAAGGYGTARTIVPPGGSYLLTGTGVTIGAAYELR